MARDEFLPSRIPRAIKECAHEVRVVVARRYLRSPYRPAVLRLVTLFSVIGVGAGVATLVIALSMNTGFRDTIQDRLLGVKRTFHLARPGTEGIETTATSSRS